jgi:hypothetical protein
MGIFAVENQIPVSKSNSNHRAKCNADHANCNSQDCNLREIHLKTRGIIFAEFCQMSDQSTHVDLLQAAIQQMYKCKATYCESVPVEEPYEGDMTWKGDVEVFNIQGHPSSKRVFAWFNRDKTGGLRPMAFLEKWPTTSPKLAIRAAIALELFVPGGKTPQFQTRTESGQRSLPNCRA